MTSVGLLIVCVVARILLLGVADLPYTWWSPVAFLWQDVLVVLGFATATWVIRSERWAGALYWLIVLQVTLTLPLYRETGSPMTWPMLRAARGTLGDSIIHTLDAVELGCMAVVAVVAWIAWRATRRCSPRRSWSLAALVLGAATVVAGPYATSRVETAGLHRNGLVTFARSIGPRDFGTDRPSTEAARSWTESPFATAPEADLRALRGRASGRNVVFVLLESTGALHLRPYGGDRSLPDPMPNLTALARRSLLFENAYAVYPESIKGFLSVIASTAPALGSVAEDYEDLATPALPSLLKRRGYHTGLFHSGRFGYLGMESIIEGRGFDVLADAGDIGGNHRSSFGVDDRDTMDHALEWIDSLPGGEPFFVTLMPVSGHHPYDVPEPGPFGDAEEIDGYRDALHYSDRMLARFLDGLADRGLANTTLTVIVGDHGEAFGEHEGNFGHVFYIYEENMRIPMLFHAPGLFDDAGRTARVASSLDLAPTVLALLGLDRPEAYQGSSLLDPTPRMALFLADYSMPLVGLRDGAWKAIHDLDSGRTRLFDVGSDPGERVDLSAREVERTETYRRHLQGWVRSLR